MLGLFLLSITFLSLDRPRPVLAAISFVLSLCFKQMALYYALAIFTYLLAVSFPSVRQPNLPLLVSLGVTVVTTFLLMFLPFLLPNQVLNSLASGEYKALFSLNIWRPHNWDTDTIGQGFHRIFPFSRGLWEDKVANFWCATNIFIKWRHLYSTSTLQKLRFCSLDHQRLSIPL